MEDPKKNTLNEGPDKGSSMEDPKKGTLNEGPERALRWKTLKRAL
jgi:hypothetical protein